MGEEIMLFTEVDDAVVNLHFLVGVHENVLSLPDDFDCVEVDVFVEVHELCPCGLWYNLLKIESDFLEQLVRLMVVYFYLLYLLNQ